MLYRCPRVRGYAIPAVLRGRRGHHERLRRPASLGQAALPDRGDTGAAIPGVAALSAGARPPRSRGALLQPVPRPRARPYPLVTAGLNAGFNSAAATLPISPARANWDASPRKP